jgi:hypothetical protein
MKKSFMFVAVAAAGMLASCSSDSLTAGPDPKIEPTQEERVPIQLAVSSPSVRATTRGTGTVGGVGNGENKWYGQTINAFMFEKGILTLAKESEAGPELYNDAAMFTPGIAGNIPSPTPTDKGEAMLTDGTIKYYPPSGNFDFFGYHVDDAKNGDLDTSADPWTVPFGIDGSQDLMSTKAAPLAWVELTDAQKAKFDDQAAYEAFADFYSAKAARKEIQPVLKFDHLLSRLAFVIVPGNDNAGGWIAGTDAVYYTAVEAAAYNATLPGAKQAGDVQTPAVAAQDAVLYADVDEYNDAKGTELTAEQFGALDEEDKIKTPAVAAQEEVLYTAETAAAYNATLPGAITETTVKIPGVDAHQDVAKAVYVKSIEVESKTTGKMAVAWTNEPENKIEWTGDGTPAWLTLKERLAYYETAHENNTISAAAYNALAEETSYYKIEGHDHNIDQATYVALDAEHQAEYEIANTCKAAYTAFGADVANRDLVDLAPTYPKMNHAYDRENPEETEIGEALIVEPKNEAYKMRVNLEQTVRTNWDGTTDTKEVTYDLLIPAPIDDPETDENESGFQANHSYKVILTVYGFERIIVTTEIVPWVEGGNIPVGGDDD